MAGGFIRRRSKVFLTIVKGIVTRKPPVRGPEVDLQAEKRLALQVRLRTKVILGAKTILGAVKGRPTKSPNTRPPDVSLQANPRAILRPKLRTHATLQKAGKIFGTSTKKPPVRHPLELLQAIARSLLRPKLRTRALLLKAGKVFGLPTNTTVRPPKVLLQAKKRLSLQTRLRVTVQRLKVFGHAVVQTIRPRPPKIVLASRISQARLKSHLRLKVFGRSTSNTKVVGPSIISVAILRANLQVRLRTHVQALKVFGHAIAQVVMPKAIQVASLAAFKRQHPAQAHLGKVFGVRTAKPPIRPVRIVHFAAQARMKLVSVHGVASLRKPTKPPVTTPPNLHKLFMDVVTGRLYWQVSQTSNPTLIMPL